MIRHLAVILAVVGSPLVHAEPFTGQVYDEGSNKAKLLYTVKRTEAKKGDTLEITGIFATPDGKEAVRDDTTVEGGKLKKYVLSKTQIGESGLMEVRGKKVHFEWTK